MSRDVTASVGYDYILRQVNSAFSSVLISMKYDLLQRYFVYLLAYQWISNCALTLRSKVGYLLMLLDWDGSWHHRWHFLPTCNNQQFKVSCLLVPLIQKMGRISVFLLDRWEDLLHDCYDSLVQVRLIWIYMPGNFYFFLKWWIIIFYTNSSTISCGCFSAVFEGRWIPTVAHLLF